MTGVEIIPTNTCPPDLPELTRRSEMYAVYASAIQLDISDGIFTEVKSWPYHDTQWSELENIGTNGSLPVAEKVAYEVHLMVQDPIRIGELLSRGGSGRIIPHLETFTNLLEIRNAFALWKAAGAREVGLALLIDTPLTKLADIAAECDVVQIMSIAKLGSQGAQYDVRAITRIQELHAQYPDLVISVDGGVGETNILELVRAGARRFGVGSAISKSQDTAAMYQRLKSLAESALQ